MAINVANTIDGRINSISEYVSNNGYSSYDPYDGLLSPIARWIVGRSQILSRIWQQIVRLLPINIRPLIGIKKISHTKTISDFASAYCLLYQSTKDITYEKNAKNCLELLRNITSPTKSGMGWGLRFPFATRFVHANANEANIFQTINAIHSFLDGYEAFNEVQHIDIAQQGFLFLKNDLGFIETDDTIAWNYWENLHVQIYNISGLMIGLCSRMWHTTKNEIYHLYAIKLYNFVKTAQKADGSWSYSNDPKGNFIDGFHTGYILEGISRGIIYGVIGKEECFQKGVDFYLRNFFTTEFTPRYFHNSTYPIDGQNAAQALQTLHFIFNVNFAKKEQIIQCFDRIDQLLWNEAGYYNYKKTKWLTYKTPMHRWVTGPMFLALSYLKNHMRHQIL